MQIRQALIQTTLQVMRHPSLSNLNLMLESSHGGWLGPWPGMTPGPRLFLHFHFALTLDTKSDLALVLIPREVTPHQPCSQPLEGEFAPAKQAVQGKGPCCANPYNRGSAVGLSLGLDYQSPCTWDCWGSGVSLWRGVLLSRGGKMWMLVEIVTCPL